jgi:hypothetical protein
MTSEYRWPYTLVRDDVTYILDRRFDPNFAVPEKTRINGTVSKSEQQGNSVADNQEILTGVFASV